METNLLTNCDISRDWSLESCPENLLDVLNNTGVPLKVFEGKFRPRTVQYDQICCFRNAQMWQFMIDIDQVTCKIPYYDRNLTSIIRDYIPFAIE